MNPGFAPGFLYAANARFWPMLLKNSVSRFEHFFVYRASRATIASELSSCHTEMIQVR